MNNSGNNFDGKSLRMKSTVNTLIQVGFIVLLTLQVSSWFSGKKVDEKMIERKVRLEYLEKELPVIKDELNVIYAKYDSLLMASVERYTELENRKQPIRNAIKQIPFIVDNFDKEQLRRALAEYYDKYK